MPHRPWHQLDFVYLRPQFSGHEQALVFCVVGDAVEDIVAVLAHAGLLVYLRQIDPADDLAGRRVDARDDVGVPQVGVDFIAHHSSSLIWSTAMPSAVTGMRRTSAKVFGSSSRSVALPSLMISAWSLWVSPQPSPLNANSRLTSKLARSNTKPTLVCHVSPTSVSFHSVSPSPKYCGGSSFDCSTWPVFSSTLRIVEWPFKPVLSYRKPSRYSRPSVNALVSCG